MAALRLCRWLWTLLNLANFRGKEEADGLVAGGKFGGLSVLKGSNWLASSVADELMSRMPRPDRPAIPTQLCIILQVICNMMHAAICRVRDMRWGKL